VRHDYDEGFTLIDVLIGMIVMGVAVTALVAALGGLTVSTQHHRAFAATESSVRSYTQALESRFSFTSTLVGGLSATGTSITVADNANALPFGSAADFYLVIDRETVHVTARAAGSSTMTIQRATSSAFADPTAVVPHVAGAPVTAMWKCPTPTNSLFSAFDSGVWTPAAGTSAAPPTQVEYWIPTGSPPTWSFQGLSACTNGGGTGYYDTTCFYIASNGQQQPDMRPECDPGLERVTLSITAAATAQRPAYTTTTQILLRVGKY